VSSAVARLAATLPGFRLADQGPRSLIRSIQHREKADASQHRFPKAAHIGFRFGPDASYPFRTIGAAADRGAGPGHRRVPGEAIAQFSSRRAQIAKTTLELAQEYERDRGHAPDQRALASMRQFEGEEYTRALGSA
jgi:hypothetical protein